MNPLSWQKRLRPLLTPVSLLYRRILAARRAKWENEGSPAFRPACQYVSVGNIAWGGTGKTPVVDWLLGWSEARGLRAVVLSRGYKAQPPELPLHVSPSRTPGEAGDEPLMLALEHPSAAVMVDPDRRRSGRWAEERLSPDLFVLDDGFQHVKVRRDLDIVLLRPDDLGDGWGRDPRRGMARRPGSAGAGRCFHDQVLAGSVGEPAPGLRTAPCRIPPPAVQLFVAPGFVAQDRNG